MQRLFLLLILLLVPAARADDGAVLVLPPSFVDIRQYGAISNDGVDDQPALVKALAAAPAGGGVTLPVGAWQFNSPWPRTDNKSVIGPFAAGGSYGPQGGITNPLAAGCVVINNWQATATGTDDPAFIPGGNFSTIAGFAIYDAVQGTATNARPFQVGTVYGAQASNYIGTDTFVVRDIGIMNAYRGIRFTGVVRCRAENAFITAFAEGVRVNESWDTTRLKAVSIAPYNFLNTTGSATTAALAFIPANLVAFHLQHVDGLQMADCMVYLCNVGLLCDPTDRATPSGQTWPTKAWATITNLCLDVCSTTCLDVEASQVQGVQVTGGSFTTTTSGGVAVKTGPNVASVGLMNVAILSSYGQEVRHGGGNLQVANCSFGSLGTTPGGSSPSILATAGTLTVAGCTFPDARPPVSWQFNGGQFGYSGCVNIGGVANIDPNAKGHN